MLLRSMEQLGSFLQLVRLSERATTLPSLAQSLSHSRHMTQAHSTCGTEMNLECSMNILGLTEIITGTTLIMRLL